MLKVNGLDLVIITSLTLTLIFFKFQEIFLSPRKPDFTDTLTFSNTLIFFKFQEIFLSPRIHDFTVSLVLTSDLNRHRIFWCLTAFRKVSTMRLTFPFPVWKESDGPTACHNKPCCWPSSPVKPEIQGCLQPDGNKARGRSDWISWKVSPNDQKPKPPHTLFNDNKQFSELYSKSLTIDTLTFSNFQVIFLSPSHHTINFDIECEKIILPQQWKFCSNECKIGNISLKTDT